MKLITEPDISIIIPVYNTGKYLSCCLDSVLSQTLRDVEVICVDDCSSDNSLSVLKKYHLKDSRVKVFGHEVNRGRSKARNLGLDMAQGEYVFFLDSDDAIPNSYAMEALYKKAKEDNSDITMGRVMLYYVDSQHSFVIPAKHNLKKGFSNKGILDVPLIINHLFVTNFFKRSFLENNKIRFDESLIRAEDIPFAASIFTSTNRISMINNVIYFYRKLGKMNLSPTYVHNESTSFYYLAACENTLKILTKKRVDGAVFKVYEDLFWHCFSYAAGIMYHSQSSLLMIRKFMIGIENLLNRVPFMKDDVLPIYHKVIFYIDKGLYYDAWLALLSVQGIKLSLLSTVRYRIQGF